MKDKIEFLIETDILLSHLQHDNNSISDLEFAMAYGNCFISVVTASELYFNKYSVEEFDAVNGVIYAFKVLGIHQRYSLNISEFFNKVATVRDAIVCSLAKNNKLPILTNNFERFSKSGIKIITPNELRGSIDTW